MDTEAKWLPAIIDSALGSAPIAGASLSNAFALWRQKKVNMAREVLLTHIRQGDIEALNQDEFFSMLTRFSRSVHEGIAKRNLILLARLISGMGKVEKSECKSETFVRYAGMLEFLGLDELKYLADFIAYYSESRNKSLFNMKEYDLQENPMADILKQKGVLISDFEVWQEEHIDWKNPSRFPSDICTKRTYYLSADMQNIVDKYGINWTEIANMDIE